MTANEYAEQLVREFLKNVTDHVFLSIQGSERLMRDHQTQVDRDGLRTVNTAIGSKVKELFQLENDGVCKAPRSWLIKDFTYHKPR